MHSQRDHENSSSAHNHLESGHIVHLHSICTDLEHDQEGGGIQRREDESGIRDRKILEPQSTASGEARVVGAHILQAEEEAHKYGELEKWPHERFDGIHIILLEEGLHFSLISQLDLRIGCYCRV